MVASRLGRQVGVLASTIDGRGLRSGIATLARRSGIATLARRSNLAGRINRQRHHRRCRSHCRHTVCPHSRFFFRTHS